MLEVMKIACASENCAQLRLSSSFQLDAGFIIAVKIETEVAVANRSDSTLAQALYRNH